MRPKQAQAVEDDNNRAAFVADDAGGKIDLLCQRRNDQKKDYAKRNDNVLANDRARAPAQGRTPARHSQSCRASRPRRPVPALHRIRERPCRARHPRRSGSAHRPPQRKTNSRQRQSIVVWLSIATLITATDVAKAGPFRDFFRALRSAIAPPHEKPRQHRSSRSSHKHNETPPSDASNSQTSVSPVPAPPGQRDVRWAKAASGANQQKTELPYGTPVPGKPGLVTSPFAPDSGYVDVTGFPPATAVEDPYTGKIFLTP